MATIEERLAKLEKAVFSTPKGTRPKDWQSTVGRFVNDPVMDEVIDHALRRREEERCHANTKAGGNWLT